MTLRDTLRTAIRGLRTNFGRSALTTLGIVIGVTAVILVMAVSRGGTDLILQQIQGIGSRTLLVGPGQDRPGPAGFSQLLTESLKEPELRSLRDPRAVSDVGAVAPTVLTTTTLHAGTESRRASVIGTVPAFAAIFQLPEPAGRFFSDDEVRGRGSALVLGSDVRDDLFPGQNPLGKTLTAKQRVFRVVGVLPPIGQRGLFNLDDSVVIPYTSAQAYLSGTKHFTNVVVQARTEARVPFVKRDIEQALRGLHKITDTDKDDFHVHTQQDLVRIVGTVTAALSALLVSIAAISLVVGGIGIMNIMLVSVTERTREIGLRKAVGATTEDILRQFLFEALALTLIGGAAGTAIGIALSYGASLVLGRQLGVVWRFSVPLTSVLLGVGVAAAVGLTFGLYPARKASRKSPIEALRHE